MKQAFKHRNAARGFSIIELMVAVTISLLLLMGVVALFVSSRASYETTERLSRIQESGRYALDQFTSDIRAAGYQGCARVTPGSSRANEFAINTLKTNTELLWNMAVPAQGFDGRGGSTWEPTFDPATASLDPAPVADADVLILRIPRRDVPGVQLTETQTTADEPLQVGVVNPQPLETGDLVMISDCEARAWFQVTSLSGGGEIGHIVSNPATITSTTRGTFAVPGNESATLLHPFKEGAEIVPITTVIYYLAPRDEDVPERLSLWRKSGGAPRSDEIAEGVDRLEVQYGVDTTNDGRVDDYVDAGDIVSWDRVYSVQVALLARAPDEYGTDLDGQEYVLFSTPDEITAGPFNDRAQRKVFTATVAVRNTIID
jgi:type IV pilus assembly protein PilW